MGELFGFLRYARELPADRDPLERLQDWNEIHELLAPEGQKEQAGRCMGCAVPFCHSGIMLGGAITGCPLNNLIPEWNDLLYRQEWELAKERLLRTNCFPEFTGRVCPAPCEGACVCGVHQPQITIRQNELSIIEHAFANGQMKPCPPARRSGKTVAIVGGGPAGLACAQTLNRLGHQVTVYERSDRVGGLLMYGIPNMKLEKRIISRRVELMEQEGVTFLLNAHIGVDLPAEELLSRYDATVLCCGSGKARDLQVEGRKGKGVHFAVEYLTAATRRLLDENAAVSESLNAKGKHVLIVGGGDTGTDCVGTALRQGCKSVQQLEIMPKAPLSRLPENPWPEYPRVLKTDYAQQEAIARFGDDPRHYQVQTETIERDQRGNVCAAITHNIQWVKEENGRLSPRRVENTTRRWQADLILIAMGFVGPEDTLMKAFGLPQDSRSNVAAEDYHTSRKGVFVAGDMHSGQSLVVRAIHEGQQAAAACDKYLSVSEA